MNKVYIDGNVLVKDNAVFYAKSITCYCNNVPKDAEIIKVKNNLFEVNNEFGSLFTDVYIKGGLTGYKDSDVSLSNIDFIYRRFCRKLNLISQLLQQVNGNTEIDILLLQEQYLAVYSLVEYYFCSTLCMSLRQDQRCYDRILKMQHNRTSFRRKDEIAELLNIINRKPHKPRKNKKLSRQEGIINKINSIVFHKNDIVVKLYNTVYGKSFDNDFTLFKGNLLERRHQITHKMGYDEKFKLIDITKSEVLDLIIEAQNMCDNVYNKIETVVKKW